MLAKCATAQITSPEPPDIFHTAANSPEDLAQAENQTFRQGSDMKVAGGLFAGIGILFVIAGIALPFVPTREPTPFGFIAACVIFGGALAVFGRFIISQTYQLRSDRVVAKDLCGSRELPFNEIVRIEFWPSRKTSQGRRIEFMTLEHPSRGFTLSSQVEGYRVAAGRDPRKGEHGDRQEGSVAGRYVRGEKVNSAAFELPVDPPILAALSDDSGRLRCRKPRKKSD